MGKALSKLRLGDKADGVRGREFQVGGTACAEAKSQERAGPFRASINHRGRHRPATQPPKEPWPSGQRGAGVWGPL